MHKLSVYLGHVDINSQGTLEVLGNGSPGQGGVIAYFFHYALIAERVYMQGSAPMKSAFVLKAYEKLEEAFKRNEKHEDTPIFAFVLSDECDGYQDYIHQRLSLLKGAGFSNGELMAYNYNQAENTSQRLDADLSFITIPKRQKSVSKAFRKDLMNKFQGGRLSDVTDETANEVIDKIAKQEILQTFALINSLERLEPTQRLAVYNIVRHSYRCANAYGSNCVDSDARPQLYYPNLVQLFDVLGTNFIMDYPTLLSSCLLFKLRSNAALALLVSEYWKCQNQSDINILLKILKHFKNEGKPSALFSLDKKAWVNYLLRYLTQYNLGGKALNKGIEEAMKFAIPKWFDDDYERHLLEIFSSVGRLNKDLKHIQEAPLFDLK